MDGILNRKLSKWLMNAIKEVNSNGLTQEIHLDEIFGNSYKDFSKADILQNSYQVFIYLVRYIIKKKVNLFNANLFLSIDLESENNVLQGLPKSLVDLTLLVDTHSIPEIIIYIDLNPNEIPLTELYRVPVLLEPFVGNNSVTMFYKESRLIEECLSNSDYTREIDIVYNQ